MPKEAKCGTSFLQIGSTLSNYDKDRLQSDARSCGFGKIIFGEKKNASKGKEDVPRSLKSKKKQVQKTEPSYKYAEQKDSQRTKTDYSANPVLCQVFQVNSKDKKG